eukprot:7731744-Ditylum_brightwellii.AAC.1
MEDITTTTTIKTGMVETTGTSTIGPMGDATIQDLTAKQRCRAIRMKRHPRTRWEEVKEDANVG